MTGELKCPKCKGSALSSQRTDIPSSTLYKIYVKFKCLSCGAMFDLVERQ